MRKCRRDGKVPVENITNVPRTLKSYVSSLYFCLFSSDFYFLIWEYSKLVISYNRFRVIWRYFRDSGINFDEFSDSENSDKENCLDGLVVRMKANFSE